MRYVEKAGLFFFVLPNSNVVRLILLAYFLDITHLYLLAKTREKYVALI